ncbi:hypothetical protein QBC42DRAFT_45780 [Cladorrhinum samala]|uniref:C2H2-type domain-containing protein n=1 Tax=Cladorrhinum samala TaxID=585594 RepID=A0AAV9HVR5_9PEZI|nr:hypothetical protein QBC42DRAFT_45780 [Cladorrhinum samala]
MHRTPGYSSYIDPNLEQYYYAQASSSGSAMAGPSNQPTAGTASDYPASDYLASDYLASDYLEPVDQTGEQGADDGYLTDPETAAQKPYKCPHCRRKRYRLQCELDKHLHNHTRRRRCPIRGCQAGSGETRDLNRHLWTNHREYARENNVPKEEIPCDFPGCDYKGRKDNVKRHKDTHGHWVTGTGGEGGGPSGSGSGCGSGCGSGSGSWGGGDGGGGGGGDGSWGGGGTGSGIGAAGGEVGQAW